jgi:hypothetical protein
MEWAEPPAEADRGRHPGFLSFNVLAGGPGRLTEACDAKVVQMAGRPDRLTRLTDPVFGDLVWEEGDRVWIGRVEFAGRTVRLELDPDRTNPTQEEQLAVVEPSRIMLDGLRREESKLRQQAAKQVAEAIVQQQDEVELPEEDFANTLELVCISLHGCGELQYRSPDFFPGQHVTVYFNEDLSFGDAEVYD